MNRPFSNSEYADMHFIYGQADGNALEAVRRYQARYPNRRQPSANTFSRLHQRLHETGVLQPKFADCGRYRTQRITDAEDDILQMVDEDPSLSTRNIARDTGVSRHTVWRTLHENLLYPYHLQRVQCLRPEDYPRRVEFCEWLLQRHRQDQEFISKILFTDEATFTRRGIANYHNYHIWADENPHQTRNARFQEEFSINVWLGICGDHLIGPHLLPSRLSGVSFLSFLENDLPGLLEDLPLALRQTMWFLLDGAPPHFAVAVRNWLNEHYRARWIGRNGAVDWSPRSPDLNMLDFYGWGTIKQIVYASEVNNAEELWQRVQAACAQIREDPETFARVRNSLVHRAETCVEVEGRHFEQLL